METNKYCEAGNILQYKLKKYTEAHFQYLLAIALQPDSIEALMNSAQNLRVHLKKHYEAIQRYNKVIELNPKIAYAYSGRSLCHGALGNIEMQLADYTEMINRSKPDADKFYSRALLNLKLNKTADAIYDCEKAIFLNKNSKAQKLLEKIKASQKQY